jgi:Na+/proline symporter
MALVSRQTLGLFVLPLYFVATIAIGWLAHRRSETANSYLSASHSLPTWVVTAAYLSANSSA